MRSCGWLERGSTVGGGTLQDCDAVGTIWLAKVGTLCSYFPHSFYRVYFVRVALGDKMDGSAISAWLFWARNLPWGEVRSLFELALYFLAVVAILGCLARLGTIRAIIKDFREARGPLWDLQKTVEDLKNLEPVIHSLKEQVQGFGGHMTLIDKKIDAARKQVSELQVETVSNRTDAEEAPQPALAGLIRNAAHESSEDENWQELREIWKKNTHRIEYVIDNIADGRKKVAYDRLPRTNYDRIVNKLQGQDVITAAAANASRSLNELFNRYRPRNRRVPDEVVQSLRVLDGQLDRELVSHARIIAEDLVDDEPTGASPTRVVRPSRPSPNSPATINFSGSEEPAPLR